MKLSEILHVPPDLPAEEVRPHFLLPSEVRSMFGRSLIATSMSVDSPGEAGPNSKDHAAGWGTFALRVHPALTTRR